MLVLQEVRSDRDGVIAALSRRGKDYASEIDQILELDTRKRQLQSELETLLAQANKNAKRIGDLMRRGEHSEADRMKKTNAAGKVRSGELHTILEGISEQLHDALQHIPNPLHPEVMMGAHDTDHELCFSSEVPDVAGCIPHWDVARHLNLVDFSAGVKVSGAGLPLYTGLGAKFQRALAQYFLEYNIDAGYLEIAPPFIVNRASAFGTGQLPDKDGQMYHLGNDDFFLIPTSEIPLTNIHRGDILSEASLPIKYTAHSPCFRREAGSYGKDVRGLNRVHQFEKVEIVQITSPNESSGTLLQMVDHVRKLLESLGLPFRLLKLCGKDTGFAAAITYDFEVYAMGQGKWLEVSSISNFRTFQSHRMKIRYKTKDHKTRLCHTLNGSSLALPRIYAALLENNYREGVVHLPSVLHSYMGGLECIGH